MLSNQWNVFRLRYKGILIVTQDFFPYGKIYQMLKNVKISQEYYFREIL